MTDYSDLKRRLEDGGGDFSEKEVLDAIAELEAEVEWPAPRWREKLDRKEING